MDDNETKVGFASLSASLGLLHVDTFGYWAATKVCNLLMHLLLIALVQVDESCASFFILRDSQKLSLLYYVKLLEVALDSVVDWGAKGLLAKLRIFNVLNAIRDQVRFLRCTGCSFEEIRFRVATVGTQSVHWNSHSFIHGSDRRLIQVHILR